jgi:exoribonuclease-2
VQLGEIDAMALDVSGTVIEKIITEQTEVDAHAEGMEESLEDLEDAATGPIAIAMNVNEAPAEE